jgi:hypothetical protein
MSFAERKESAHGLGNTTRTRRRKNLIPSEMDMGREFVFEDAIFVTQPRPWMDENIDITTPTMASLKNFYEFPDGQMAIDSPQPCRFVYKYIYISGQSGPQKQSGDCYFEVLEFKVS